MQLPCYACAMRSLRPRRGDNPSCLLQHGCQDVGKRGRRRMPSRSGMCTALIPTLMASHQLLRPAGKKEPGLLLGTRFLVTHISDVSPKMLTNVNIWENRPKDVQAEPPPLKLSNCCRFATVTLLEPIQEDWGKPQFTVSTAHSSGKSNLDNQRVDLTDVEDILSVVTPGSRLFCDE